MTPHPPSGSTADWLADRALRALIGVALRMPFERRVAFMGAVLRRGIGPLVGYRRRAAVNLAMIYPDMPAARRRSIADGVCDNFGRTLIENYSWQDFGQRLAGTVATGDGLTAIAQAKADNRPVIFVTGHFGNHEAPRHILSHMGYDIGGLYRPMTNAYFNDHYAKTMTAWGGPVFAQGKRGPANTATSAADLALKFDALVVPYFGKRAADGLSFDVTVQAPIATGSAARMMQDMTDRLAAMVTDAPEQWFWVHRRWKMRR